jgi:ABC-type transport system involved in multi-copper enzyme maturation permease subunit
VVGGKLATIAVALLALVLVTFAFSALWSWMIATAEGRPANWPSVLDLARGMGAGWLILAVWAGLGVVLGVLFRSTSLAVGLGLVWALAVENLIRGFAGLLGFLDAFQKGLPGVNAGSLAASLGAAAQGDTGGTPGVTAAVSGPQALVVLVAYAVTLSVIAALALQRQDVA